MILADLPGCAGEGGPGVLFEPGTTVVEAGHQCLSGKVALGYARARDVAQGIANGDVERAQNQQRVILAIRDKVLSNLPALVTQAGRCIAKSRPGCTRTYPWRISYGWRCWQRISH